MTDVRATIVRLRVLTSDRLRKNRRISYVLLLVFAILSSALAVAMGQGTGRPGTHQSGTNVRFENARNSAFQGGAGQ